MRIRAGSFSSVVLAIALLAIAAPACGKKSTNPGGGGGTAKELNSPDLGAGAMYQHTFATVGSFPYHCRFHGSMTATVNVVASGGANGAAVSIAGQAFNPASVTINQNTTVTWTNNDGTTHSVTSD
jgi:plastocyanin